MFSSNAKVLIAVVAAMAISDIHCFMSNARRTHNHMKGGALRLSDMAQGPEVNSSSGYMQTMQSTNAVVVEKTPASNKMATENEMKPKATKKAPAHSGGMFSPLVYLAKDIMGDQELNKVRAKAISLHSNVIKDFVATSETPFGQTVLRNLFSIVDANKDGILDQKEISTALRTLGFTWLKEKQVSGIIKRADADENGVIDLVEFTSEAPKTLKTNLAKLAKKNGNELGFLV